VVAKLTAQALDGSRRRQPGRAPSCVALAKPPAAIPQGFAFSSLTVCSLAFVDGVTIAQAAQVVVTLANGKTVHTRLQLFRPLDSSKTFATSRLKFPMGYG
jgi:hypothetical protein